MLLCVCVCITYGFPGSGISSLTPPKSHQFTIRILSTLTNRHKESLLWVCEFIYDFHFLPKRHNVTVPDPVIMSASAKAKKRARQRTHRYTSNVFSMFNQAQIQEFKEAFTMIDQNRDGFIDKDDLLEMLTSLGKNPDDKYLEGMVNDAQGPINFTMFLTLFGEKLNGTDPEDVIMNAFACFDEKSNGFLSEERLREIMTTMGDRWTDEMVDELLYGAPRKQGNFDYQEFIKTLKHGAKEKEDEAAQRPTGPLVAPR